MKSQRYKIVYDLLEGRRGFTFLMFVVMLLAALAESLGLSLILPLLSGLVGGSELSGRAAELTAYCLSFFSPRYQLIGLLCALSAAFIVKNLLIILSKGMTVNFVFKLRQEWSTRVLANYLNAGYHAIIARKQGALINNVVTEPMRASKSIRLMLEMLAKIILSLNLLVVLLLVNFKITLALVVVGMFVFYLVKYRIQSYSVRFGRRRMKLSQKISSCATEGIGALKLIKSFGLESGYRREIWKKLAKYTSIETRFSVLNALPDHLVEIFVIVFITLVIALLQLWKKMDIQEIIPVIGLFLILSQRIFAYAAYVVGLSMKVASFFPSMRLVHSILNNEFIPEGNEGGRKVDRLEGDIVLHDITFSYDPSSVLFQGLNLTIEQGKMTAVVGPSGVGKSTIADMIMRFTVPESGGITAAGRDIRENDLASWRKLIGYVSQESLLLNGTIRENILVGKPDATEDEIEKAVRLANIYQFIMELPEKYNTQVGAGGMKLSGGQRQRIAIARAVIRNPHLLIFDEATSSLDNESERLIQKSIENLKGNNTVLVIAHRLSTIENADRIYRIDSSGRTEEVDFASL